MMTSYGGGKDKKLDFDEFLDRLEVSISASQLESGSDLQEHLRKIAEEEQTKYEKKKKVGPGGIDWAKEAKTFVVMILAMALWHVYRHGLEETEEEIKIDDLPID